MQDLFEQLHQLILNKMEEHELKLIKIIFNILEQVFFNALTMAQKI